MNEKVEQYIRKKTHKPNALRFWVVGGVILLYGLAQFSLFEISPRFPPLDSPNKWYQSQWFAVSASTVWPCIESLPNGGFKQACPV